MPRSAQPAEVVPNRLLATLTSQEYQRLLPHLEEVTLSFGDVLYEPRQVIPHIYFPNSGIVSLLSMVKHHSGLEVGVVGNEGMVGISIFLESPRFPHACAGAGRRYGDENDGSGVSKTHRRQRPATGLLRRYTHSLLRQISQTAVCNRFHNVDARLARWLLMTHDCLGFRRVP